MTIVTFELEGTAGKAMLTWVGKSDGTHGAVSLSGEATKVITSKLYPHVGSYYDPGFGGSYVGTDTRLFWQVRNMLETLKPKLEIIKTGGVFPSRPAVTPGEEGVTY